MKSLTASLRLLTSTFAMSLAMVPAWAEGSAPVPALTLELNAAHLPTRVAG